MTATILRRGRATHGGISKPRRSRVKLGHVVFTVADIRHTTDSDRDHGLPRVRSQRARDGLSAQCVRHHTIALSAGRRRPVHVPQEGQPGFHHCALSRRRLRALRDPRLPPRRRGCRSSHEGRRAPQRQSGVEFEDPDGFPSSCTRRWTRSAPNGKGRPARSGGAGPGPSEEAVANPAEKSPIDEAGARRTSSPRTSGSLVAASQQELAVEIISRRKADGAPCRQMANVRPWSSQWPGRCGCRPSAGSTSRATAEAARNRALPGTSPIVSHRHRDSRRSRPAVAAATPGRDRRRFARRRLTAARLAGRYDVDANSMCTGPITYRRHRRSQTGHHRLRGGAAGALRGKPSSPPSRRERSSCSVPILLPDRKREYLQALADAMKTSTGRSSDAGFVSRSMTRDVTEYDSMDPPPSPRGSTAEFATCAHRGAESALAGLPEDRVPLHRMCWGSWHGPHDGCAAAGDRRSFSDQGGRASRSRRRTRATSTSTASGRTSSSGRPRLSSGRYRPHDELRQAPRSWWLSGSALPRGWSSATRTSSPGSTAASRRGLATGACTRASCGRSFACLAEGRAQPSQRLVERSLRHGRAEGGRPGGRRDVEHSRLWAEPNTVLWQAPDSVASRRAGSRVPGEFHRDPSARIMVT